MRWESLFADLDRQFDQLRDAADAADVVEQARHEFGRISLLERLAGSVGAPIGLRLTGDRTVGGTLRRLGPDWLLLTESAVAETLVPLAAVAAIEGLTSATGRPLGTVDSRYDLRLALRAVARDRSPVTIQTTFDTEMSGTIDRVGADFLEVAAHSAWEVRRVMAVRAVLVVPLRSLLLVRAVPLG